MLAHGVSKGTEFGQAALDKAQQKIEEGIPIVVGKVQETIPRFVDKVQETIPIVVDKV